MIIVKLQGGMGNQMFQYAAGRALSLRHGVELKLDLSFLKKDPQGQYTPRKYELDVFNVKAGIATDEDLEPFQEHPGRLRRVLQRNIPALFSKVYAAESGMSYNSRFLKFPRHSYLDGFWQNEKYFSAVERQVREDLQPVLPKPAPVTVLEKEMSSRPAVSLHVRRGDFISLPGAASFHGNLNMSYYQQALQRLPAQLSAATVFIFSDDPAWCRDAFDLLANKVIVDLREAPVWDLHLMSCASANIIANSSFSWWAAWLNPHPEKIVIMPKQWYTHTHTIEAGLHVPGWILI